MESHLLIKLSISLKPLQGDFKECGVCLCSFPFWSIRALLACTALAEAARESLFLINLKAVFNRGFLKANWPLVKHNSFLWVLPPFYIGTTKYICLKKCIVLFLKKREKEEKKLLFSVYYLTEMLPCAPYHREEKKKTKQKKRNPLFFLYFSPCDIFSQDIFTAHANVESLVSVLVTSNG